MLREKVGEESLEGTECIETSMKIDRIHDLVLRIRNRVFCLVSAGLDNADSVFPRRLEKRRLPGSVPRRFESDALETSDSVPEGKYTFNRTKISSTI
jgi:hypothetical protein